MTGLQASLDLAGEVEEDLQEISANLDQMTEERDRLQAKQCEMEQEIAQVSILHHARTVHLHKIKKSINPGRIWHVGKQCKA